MFSSPLNHFTLRVITIGNPNYREDRPDNGQHTEKGLLGSAENSF